MRGPAPVPVASLTLVARAVGSSGGRLSQSPDTLAPGREFTRAFSRNANETGALALIDACDEPQRAPARTASIGEPTAWFAGGSQSAEFSVLRVFDAGVFAQDHISSASGALIGRVCRRRIQRVDDTQALAWSGLVLHLQQQLTSLVFAMTRRQEEDAIMAGIAAVAALLGVGAIVGGMRLLRRKQGGLAALLFLGGAVSLLGCLGILALLVLEQFAWH